MRAVWPIASCPIITTLCWRIIQAHEAKSKTRPPGGTWIFSHYQNVVPVVEPMGDSALQRGTRRNGIDGAGKKCG